MADTVRVERTFTADVPRVWHALTVADELCRWWGPPDVVTSVVDVDLRVGGSCRWVMHPGGRRAVLQGRVVELDPLHRLVMTHRWEGDDAETLVTIRLVAIDGGTRLELTQERLPRGADSNEFSAWWTAALAALADRLDMTDPDGRRPDDS